MLFYGDIGYLAARLEIDAFSRDFHTVYRDVLKSDTGYSASLHAIGHTHNGGIRSALGKNALITIYLHITHSDVLHGGKFRRSLLRANGKGRERIF